MLFSIIKKKEIMSYLCVQKDVNVLRSFRICHCKELTEKPACRTFYRILIFFIFRGYFLHMKAFTSEVSKEQPSAFGQADLLCEKQTSRKQSSGCPESTVHPACPWAPFSGGCIQNGSCCAAGRRFRVSVGRFLLHLSVQNTERS